MFLCCQKESVLQRKGLLSKFQNMDTFPAIYNLNGRNVVYPLLSKFQNMDTFLAIYNFNGRNVGYPLLSKFQNMDTFPAIYNLNRRNVGYPCLFKCVLSRNIRFLTYYKCNLLQILCCALNQNNTNVLLLQTFPRPE